MNKTFGFKASLIVAALLALPLAQASTLSKADYKAGKTRISADYKADKAGCASLAGNGKDICVEQAKAKEKVAYSELEYSYTGKTTDHNKVLVTKAKTAYAVAKEKCDDKAGTVKDVCVQEAKAIETTALANAKLGKQVGEAEKDATDAKRDANYDLAAKKCDALSGDAKANCVATAKATFGKT